MAFADYSLLHRKAQKPFPVAPTKKNSADPASRKRIRLARVPQKNYSTRRLASEPAPAMAHGFAAPPSLLNIRIYTEKESHPAVPLIGQFSVTEILKNLRQ
jgi:hypothetical protein